MTQRHRLGKLTPQFFRKIIFPRLGASRPNITDGPRPGGDCSVLQLNEERVLVATSDPLSYLPSIGAADSAFLSVHLLASDLTTSGFSPQYGIFDFNLPAALSDSQFAKYWIAFHSECKKLGISIIGGHTGRYLSQENTIIGGGALLAIGPKKRYLTSSMAREDDDLILTKGAAIETTAVLTRSFPRKIRKTLGPKAFDRAWEYLRSVTTVRDALTATSVGIKSRGVTAMHDATEGGVLSAAAEMASASELGLTVELQSIDVSDETRAICKLFRLDPLYSLSEGSLLIAARPFATARVLRRLSQQRIRADVIGRFSGRFRGARAVTNGGRIRLVHPSSDRYWAAYSDATRNGWS